MENQETRSSVQEDIFKQEFRIHANRELVKELRTEVRDAMMSALVNDPSISPTEREQRVGYYNGLLRALELSTATYEALIRED